MAYRRRHGLSRSSTFEEVFNPPPPNALASDEEGDSSSLAAQAIRASAAHRESSLSSAYGGGGSGFSYRDKDSDALRSKSFAAYGDRLENNDSRSGFWGILARKAKSILEDEKASQQLENPSRMKPQNSDTLGQMTHQRSESSRKVDNPTLRKGLDKITTSLNRIGDSFEKAYEEGRAKTQDIIQETQKLQIRRKGSGLDENVQPGTNNFWQQPGQPQAQTHQETQLKASRDVAMATAAKAKLLLRELKTVKADLAFAKIRCSQLEDENKVLREGREKGGTAADDDMIRLQLETLLAEKARLAHENETLSRENRFLREIIEYHQLTMQDVVYLDEGIDEVSEVYPLYPSMSSMLSMSPTSPTSPVEVPMSGNTTKMSDLLNLPALQEEENAPPNKSPSGKSSSQVRGNKTPPSMSS
ncbi:hypothetical protein MLD38_023949 [Melastoma candidum]|uniref:Uncharacterized protein n=1 Tax=Melastoma candidum TaxID=119954 RepID=A0ACB9NRN3_9MYRT|nr:hypothetical protein MLD38_023949 [Melastoma candidum]